MSRALFRKATTDAARLIRRNTAAEDPFGKTSLAILSLRRLQSRPQFPGRGKQPGVSPLPSSSSSSSSSVGFVGWYLGMLKSRPVFTKSVTSSLIYIAADLSSQVLTLLICFKCWFNFRCLMLIAFCEPLHSLWELTKRGLIWSLIVLSDDCEKIFRLLWLSENSKDGGIWSMCFGSNTSLLVQFHVKTLTQTGFHHNV